MKLTDALIALFLVLGLTGSISYCLEELSEYPASAQSSNIILSRVKRKGGRGGGGRGRGSSGKSRGSSRTNPSNPYPKQQPYNPSYNPSNPSGHVPNSAPNSYPKQPGQSYPAQTGYGQQQQHNYPGQSGNYPQTGYGQGGHGTNYGKAGGLGGLGAGTALGAGLGSHKSKGIGALGAGVGGAAVGGLLGAYGGYQLGKVVGGLGRSGHYGYYNDRHVYVRCDPPPRVEVNPVDNTTYIPKEVVYDRRCDYFEREPARYHQDYYSTNQRHYYMNTADTAGPNMLSIVFTFVSILVFGMNSFRSNDLPQLLFT